MICHYVNTEVSLVGEFGSCLGFFFPLKHSLPSGAAADSNFLTGSNY